MVQKGPDAPKMGPKWSKTFRLTILVPFGPFWTALECWQACHVWPFLVQNGPFLGHPQSWTVDPRVKKGSSPRLLCVACLWNPKYSLLEHKYGRNPLNMSKIGRNSMKKWPFFAIIMPSWKPDAWKCPNQVTASYLDQLSERYQPLCNGSASMFHNVLLITVPVDGLSCCVSKGNGICANVVIATFWCRR